MLFAQAGAHDMLSGRGDGARVLLCVLARSEPHQKVKMLKPILSSDLKLFWHLGGAVVHFIKFMGCKHHHAQIGETCLFVFEFVVAKN